MDERRVAPFTPDEVASLNEFQAAAVWSPVVCPGEGCGRKLVASEAGWSCAGCGFTQDWAPRWMTDRTWQDRGAILRREG